MEDIEQLIKDTHRHTDKMLEILLAEFPEKQDMIGYYHTRRTILETFLKHKKNWNEEYKEIIKNYIYGGKQTI